MGSTTSSTRRITVVNDDTTGVIKISDSVVYRLKGNFDEKPGTAPARAKPAPQVEDSQLESSKSVAEAAPPPPPSPKKVSPPPPTTAGTSSGEEYWRVKYQETRRHADLLHRETTKEFQRGLQEVESLFSPPSKSPVCDELESKVLKCYLDNPNSSLNCSHQVKAFTECVDAMRLNALASKG